MAGSQVFRALNTRTITGPVAGTGESVSANLGTTPKPVVLVWNADYNSTGRTFAAWKVNGGACRALGAGQLRTFAGPFELATVQGVALPSDGLVPGVNTFELCLGEIDPGASLGLGFRTIALRKGN